MLNGDFSPNRFLAQQEAILTLFSMKKRLNQENTMGLVSLNSPNSASSSSNGRPMVMASLTQDSGKILKTLHHMKPMASLVSSSNRTSGLDNSEAISVSALLDAFKMAQLVLKHRPNKAGQQRIVLFLSSPLSVSDYKNHTNEKEQEESLLNVAKSLRKNNIALDIVHFTHLSPDSLAHSLLTKFFEAFNPNEADSSSCILHISPSSTLLVDVLARTPIYNYNHSQSQGSSALPGIGNFEFGVDPELDPELALALKLSMDEQQAQLANSQPVSISTTSNDVQADVDMNEDLDEMDPELAAAIAMSMQELATLESQSSPNATNNTDSKPKRKFPDEA